MWIYIYSIFGYVRAWYLLTLTSNLLTKWSLRFCDISSILPIIGVNSINLQSELVAQNNNTAGPSLKKTQEIPSSDNNHINMRRKDDDSSSASPSTGLLPAVTAQVLQQQVSGDTGKAATSQKKSKILADTEAVSMSVSVIGIISKVCFPE